MFTCLKPPTSNTSLALFNSTESLVAGIYQVQLEGFHLSPPGQSKGLMAAALTDLASRGCGLGSIRAMRNGCISSKIMNRLNQKMLEG